MRQKRVRHLKLVSVEFGARESACLSGNHVWFRCQSAVACDTRLDLLVNRLRESVLSPSDHEPSPACRSAVRMYEMYACFDAVLHFVIILYA